MIDELLGVDFIKVPWNDEKILLSLFSFPKELNLKKFLNYKKKQFLGGLTWAKDSLKFRIFFFLIKELLLLSKKIILKIHRFK